MKGKTIGCAAVVIALLSGSLVEAAEENNDEWMKKHAVVKNTESTTRDSNGNVASIKTVNDTTIYIKQTVTEIQKADGKGGMYTAEQPPHWTPWVQVQQ